MRFRGFFGNHVLRYFLPGAMKQGVGFSVTREQTMPLTILAPFAASSTSG